MARRSFERTDPAGVRACARLRAHVIRDFIIRRGSDPTGAPTPDATRDALAPLDARQQKLVAGLFTVMIGSPTRVREREWMAQQLAEVTLLGGDFDVESGPQAVEQVQRYLGEHGPLLLRASLTVFQTRRARSGRARRFWVRLRGGPCEVPRLMPDAGDADAANGAAPSQAIERDLGEQPLAARMAELGLAPKDLVAASSEQLTHKMVSRAMKGRRLTANTMGKVVRAFAAAATEAEVEAQALFNYEP